MSCNCSEGGTMSNRRILVMTNSEFKKHVHVEPVFGQGHVEVDCPACGYSEASGYFHEEMVFIGACFDCKARFAIMGMPEPADPPTRVYKWEPMHIPKAVILIPKGHPLRDKAKKQKKIRPTADVKGGEVRVICTIGGQVIFDQAGPKKTVMRKCRKEIRNHDRSITEGEREQTSADTIEVTIP